MRDQLGARVAASAGADFAGPRIEREAQPGGREAAHKSRIPKSVVPAKAGTHRAPHRGLWNMGPRLRGDDSTAKMFTSSQGHEESHRLSRTQIATSKRRRGDPDRLGQPELARREKRRRRRPFRGGKG